MQTKEKWRNFYYMQKSASKSVDSLQKNEFAQSLYMNVDEMTEINVQTR